MKYRLLAVLLLLASLSADAQLFKKKRKVAPEVAAARAAAKQAAAEAEGYGNQQLALEDLLDMMDRRDDSGYVRSLVVKAGFNRHATAGPSQVVYMGDTAKGVTKYTEMVFLQSDSSELQVIQWCTRHRENFEKIRSALRSNKTITGTPILTEDEEWSEAFYNRDYNFLIESVGKKTKFVISIWLRGAKLTR